MIFSTGKEDKSVDSNENSCLKDCIMEDPFEYYDG